MKSYSIFFGSFTYHSGSNWHLQWKYCAVNCSMANPWVGGVQLVGYPLSSHRCQAQSGEGSARLSFRVSPGKLSFGRGPKEMRSQRLWCKQVTSPEQTNKPACHGNHNVYHKACVVYREVSKGQVTKYLPPVVCNHLQIFAHEFPALTLMPQKKKKCYLCCLKCGKFKWSILELHGGVSQHHPPSSLFASELFSVCVKKNCMNSIHNFQGVRGMWVNSYFTNLHKKSSVQWSYISDFAT